MTTAFIKRQRITYFILYTNINTMLTLNILPITMTQNLLIKYIFFSGLFTSIITFHACNHWTSYLYILICLKYNIYNNISKIYNNRTMWEMCTLGHHFIKFSFNCKWKYEKCNQKKLHWRKSLAIKSISLLLKQRNTLYKIRFPSLKFWYVFNKKTRNICILCFY